MLTALSQQPKAFAESKRKRRSRAEKREKRKLARRRTGGGGSSPNSRRGKTTVYPATVCSLASERKPRRSTTAERFTLDFGADSSYGLGDVETRGQDDKRTRSLKTKRNNARVKRAENSGDQRIRTRDRVSHTRGTARVHSNAYSSDEDPDDCRVHEDDDSRVHGHGNMDRTGQIGLTRNSSQCLPCGTDGSGTDMHASRDLESTAPTVESAEKVESRDSNLRPPLSTGDPKQFILSGSIGDQRVRVLVDTGATISFISKALVPLLKPSPEVLRSELSIMMGTGEMRDSDHYVDVQLILNSTALDAKLHLLELPPAFDVIAKKTGWLHGYTSTSDIVRPLLHEANPVAMGCMCSLHTRFVAIRGSLTTNGAKGSVGIWVLI